MGFGGKRDGIVRMSGSRDSIEQREEEERRRYLRRCKSEGGEDGEDDGCGDGLHGFWISDASGRRQRDLGMASIGGDNAFSPLFFDIFRCLLNLLISRRTR